MTAPWNEGVQGEQSLVLINSEATTIRVQAGPGTGKTFGLARRVQRILAADGLNVPANDVLIVAFNRVIAKRLRTDIEERLGAGADQPRISTVHALCLQVVGEPIRLLLDHERDAMIYDVIHDHPDLADGYDDAKQALADHEAGIAENLALWQAVREWLTRHRAILISDLPRLLLDRMHAGDYEGARYQHVIVDEFQDLTPGEQLLFMKLRRQGGSFVALGDPKQSIYRFRGNDPEGLSKLETLDPDAEVTNVPLAACLRCPTDLVTAANRLMTLHPPALEAGSASDANIHVVFWSKPEDEAKGMARHIVENIRACPDNDHLVMVTRRQFGYRLREEMLEIAPELSVDLTFSESSLETWAVREAFIYFCALVDPDPPTWRAWFSYKTPGPDADDYLAPKRNADAYLRFLTSTADNISREAVEHLAQGPNTEPGGVGSKVVRERAKRFVELTAAFGPVLNQEPYAIIEAIFDSSRWIGGTLGTAETDMDLLRSRSLAILEDIGESEPPNVRLQNLARSLRHQIATREPFAPSEEHDLQITTLWGAKGITADHVYVLGLCQPALPGSRRPEYPGTDLEFVREQRRLFYVSITRARGTLVLSRATRIRPWAAKRLGLGALKANWQQWARLEMSEFLRDIMPVLPDAEDGDQWEGCLP